MPAAGRPFGQFLIEGGKDTLKQAPDEFFQESIGKLTHNIGYLFTDGATPQEFYDRVKSGWGDPAEGAVTAFVASTFLFGAGAPRALQAHVKYRHKITAVQKTVDAAKIDTQRQTNPDSFKRDLRPIVDALPVYKAIAEAVEAGGINADEAIDIIGLEAVEKIRELHGADLFGGTESTLDAIAGDHGFTDGHEFLDALVNARPKADAIKERIREIIMEREEKARGWLKETEAVPGDAAYHAGDRLELMALQLEGLRKILNDKTQKRIERLNLKALTDAADTTVKDMLVRDIGQHRRYAMAESKAGRESIRAAQAGDYQTAYDQLQLQMFNHAITTAMYRYRESGEKFRHATTFRKMVRALDAMHEDSREPLRQLLTRYGVVLRSVKSVSPNGHQVLHFVTHAQTLHEMDRITADSRFEKAFVAHNGLAAYKLVRKTINYMADFRQEQRGGRLMNWLHNQYITSVLGINFYSASKQRLGYFTAISPMSDAVNTGENGTMVSLKYLLNAMWDFGVKGNIGLTTKRFEAIKDESRIMKARDEGGATQELRNAIEAISPTGGDMRIAGMTIPVKAFRDNLFKLIQLFDRATAGPIYTACTRMYMDGKVKDLTGMTEAEIKKGAIAFANSLAMTQTSPFRVDHSAIQRGENIIDKFSAVCISGVMQPGNMLYQKIAGARRGQVTRGQVGSYIAKTYIAMSYTQMLFSTLHGLATGEEDPWPAWYEFILAPLDNMVSWIPYVRNIVSVSKYGSRGKGVPQLEAGYDALIAQPINAVKKAEKGDIAAGGWLAVKSFCFAAGIPVNMGAKIFQDMGKVMGVQPPKKSHGRKRESKKRKLRKQ